MSNKGFTLIELLIVIAIIGILAGILFVAIDPGKQTRKAKIANIKGQLAQVPNQAIVDNTDTFANVCAATSNTYALVKSATEEAGETTVTCNANATDFAAWVKYKSEDGASDVYYCVDKGGVKELATAPTATSTTCTPATN